jgi:hypothetical protein
MKTDLPPSLTDWPAGARARYEERAAIMQYDGALSREEAERNAERLTREQWAEARKEKR